MSFLEQFSLHSNGITIINLDRNSELSKRNVGELVGEIFAYYSWGIMDDYTFDCLKDIIVSVLKEKDISDAHQLARDIIEGMKY